MLLAHGGQHTYEEIAEVVGRARSMIQRWIDQFESHGVLSLSHQQGQGGGKPSELRDQRIQQELRKGLRSGRWMTGVEIQSWLCERHGMNRSLDSVYYWLGEHKGALNVPVPFTRRRTLKMQRTSKSNDTKTFKPWSCLQGERCECGYVKGRCP